MSTILLNAMLENSEERIVVSVRTASGTVLDGAFPITRAAGIRVIVGVDDFLDRIGRQHGLDANLYKVLSGLLDGKVPSLPLDLEGRSHRNQ